jgi:Family of unknown function (DUF5302)
VPASAADDRAWDHRELIHRGGFSAGILADGQICVGDPASAGWRAHLVPPREPPGLTGFSPRLALGGMRVRSAVAPVAARRPARRRAGVTGAKLWMWPSREEVCMADAVPEPEGSGEEIKRKFREALERKRARYADASAVRGGKDAGKVHGARGLARGRRSFRRKAGG